MAWCYHIGLQRLCNVALAMFNRIFPRYTYIKGLRYVAFGAHTLPLLAHHRLISYIHNTGSRLSYMMAHNEKYEALSCAEPSVHAEDLPLRRGREPGRNSEKTTSHSLSGVPLSSPPPPPPPPPNLVKDSCAVGYSSKPTRYGAPAEHKFTSSSSQFLLSNSPQHGHHPPYPTYIALSSSDDQQRNTNGQLPSAQAYDTAISYPSSYAPDSGHILPCYNNRSSKRRPIIGGDFEAYNPYQPRFRHAMSTVDDLSFDSIPVESISAVLSRKYTPFPSATYFPPSAQSEQPPFAPPNRPSATIDPNQDPEEQAGTVSDASSTQFDHGSPHSSQASLVHTGSPTHGPRFPRKKRSKPTVYQHSISDHESDTGEGKLAPLKKVSIFVTRILPSQIYLHLLLRLPSLYFSRVARIFEDADLSLSELKQMALETILRDNGTYADILVQQSTSFESCSGPKSPLKTQYEKLTKTWEFFIDTVINEWNTFNIISVLILPAVLTVLQLDGAATDPVIRYSALFSLMCALISLLFGCVYVIRFSGMRKTYKAAEWALDAQKNDIWWNVWVLLAMPAVWLAWSIILYIACILAFVWRTNEQDTSPPANLSESGLLFVRITISALLLLGVVYGALILKTFRRYGEAMDIKWEERIEKWILEEEEKYSQFQSPEYCAAQTLPPEPVSNAQQGQVDAATQPHLSNRPDFLARAPGTIPPSNPATSPDSTFTQRTTRPPPSNPEDNPTPGHDHHTPPVPRRMSPAHTSPWGSLKSSQTNETPDSDASYNSHQRLLPEFAPSKASTWPWSSQSPPPAPPFIYN